MAEAASATSDMTKKPDGNPNFSAGLFSGQYVDISAISFVK